MFRARTTVIIVFVAFAVIASFYTASQFLGSGDTRPLTNRHRDESAVLRVPINVMTNAQETPNEELTKISAAWKRRETQTQGLYCKWKCETVWPAGPIGYPLRNGGIAELSEDTTISETLECTFTGSSFRFSQSGPKWNGKAAKFTPCLYLMIANSKTNLTFFGRDGMGGDSFLSASYDPPGRNTMSDHFHLVPLVLIFRPFNGQFGEKLHLASIQPVDSDASSGALEGLAVKKITANGRSYPSYILWLDEDRDYLPVRVEAYSQGCLNMEVVITYREFEDGIWMPETWKTTLYRSAPSIHVRTTGRVVQCVINPELTEEDFTFALPANTLVTDARTGEYYILRPNGTKRPITREEMVPDVTYAAMVATESGKGVSPEFKALLGRIETLGKEPRGKQLAIVDDIEEYYNTSQNANATAHLGMATAGQFVDSGDTQAAATVLRSISQFLSEGWEHLARMANQIEDSARLNHSVGQQFKVVGTTLDGNAFDLGAMRGKVVLVTFWFIGCRACLEEFAVLKRVYQSYHDKGFEIVGITCDRDVDRIKKTLQDRGVPWLNLYRDNDGPQPTIKHYGIAGFPTNVLIDRDGKVVWVSNDCAELRERVAELVAQPE